MKKCAMLFISFWKSLNFPFKILLVISLLIALVLGVIGFFTRSIFTYDQARDALQAYSIWHDHHLKLLGPETDIPGVFHGVLWYYLLATFYGIGKVPEFVIGVFCFLSFCTVLMTGVLAHKLFKNAVITVLTIVLYALSPLVQVTTRWVSNPILPFLVTPILLLFLWKFFEKQKVWLSLCIGICFGIMIQGEFAFVLLLVALPVYWIIQRWHIRFRDILSFFAGLILTTSSFFIAEVKFKGQAAKGILQFFHEGSAHHTITQILLFVWTRVLDLFAITFFPFPTILLGIVTVIFFTFIFLQLYKGCAKQILFLLLWEGMLLPFLFFHVGISTSYFLFYPFLAPLVILVSFVLGTIAKKTYIFWPIILLSLIFQIYRSIFYIQTNTSPLPAQQGTTLPLEKQVITYTYKESQGKPFTINTITNPLFINTTWAYLYITYGLPTYGYLPYFAGRSQVGQVESLPEKQFATKIRFFIIEPPIGIPDFYIRQITSEENLVSKVITTRDFGNYIVEKRQLSLK